MTSKFQGSGFCLSLPNGVIDASAYCFILPPSVGSLQPNITVRMQKEAGPSDLAEWAAGQRELLEPHVEDLKLMSEVSNTRGNWTYTINVVEWGPPDSRMVQKIFYIFVPGEKACLYTLTCTDLAENFKRSEPAFDQIIGSFDPNGIQLL